MVFENPKKNPALALLSWPCRDIIATSKLLCCGLTLVSQDWLIVTKL